VNRYAEKCLLLIRLIIAHLITDFLFKSDSWVNQKDNNGFFSKHLYVHGIVAGILAYCFSGLWNLLWIPIIVGSTHVLIDVIKVKCEDNIQTFLTDQLFHFMILLVIWLQIINPKSGDIEVLGQIFPPGIKIWIIIASYLLIIWPTGVLISKMTEKLRRDIFQKEISDREWKEESLEKTGKWIGWLERFLILTFFLLKQYEVIGLLVAVKTFRFSGPQKLNEYILIGTLLSFSIAILVGLIVSLFL